MSIHASEAPFFLLSVHPEADSAGLVNVLAFDDDDTVAP